MTAPARQAFLGAGANLGDRLGALRAAAAGLRADPGILTLESSAVYETDPVGLIEQPAFLNAVFGIETTLPPEQLLARLQGLEQAAGRQRVIRWGPRTLDLDLLAYEGETRAGPDLQLPHPRMLGRAFVTVPLRELLEHPRFRRTCWDGLRATLNGLPPPSGVRRSAVMDIAHG